MAKNTIIKIGQTFRRQLALTYVDDNTPVDLTGCEAFCQMRDYPGGNLAATAVCTLDYALGRGGFAAVYVSDYRSGAGGTLLTLNGDGHVLGSAALDRDVVSLSAEGKQLLVMTSGSLARYNQELVRQSANETLMTAKRAILRPARDILLLYAYSAERFSF